MLGKAHPSEQAQGSGMIRFFLENGLEDIGGAIPVLLFNGCTGFFEAIARRKIDRV